MTDNPWYQPLEPPPADASAFELWEEREGKDWVVDAKDRTLLLRARLTEHPEWAFDATFTEAHERPVLTSLSVFPVSAQTPADGLQNKVLRSIKITDLYRAAWQRLDSWQLAKDYFGRDLPAGYRNVNRPGRRGRPLLEYAQWAARYVEALPTGAPIAHLKRETQLPRQTITHYIDQARRKGLLTPAPDKGVAGGELTTKAKELLDGAR